MRNLPGLLMLDGAAWLAWSALGRRRRARDAARRGEAPPPLHPSLELMGGIMPPLVNIGLAIAGGQVAFAFWLTGGAGLFGPLDLIGFLALLAAYAWWLGMKARHRLPA
ncbi:hypothetical protein [Belnapia rosea]|uniref:Uncharacterized protein n=1 Tax=Belnapia rosea TaxID=938405 RepID=A0A1G6YGE2_9PROT|nr:hypothetical protein [Belnapia rosea]SDD89053.1 hypothetical protein SAMN04487779_101442 [Belnapia rosea]